LLINLKEVGQEVDPNPDGGTVYGDIRKCKIRNWEERSKNREHGMRYIKEAKAHIALYSQLRRRRKFLNRQMIGSTLSYENDQY
jgi:hypothetical protein